MQLWNDYEGKTLAGTFPIEALLLTEGRNASFSTRDRDGRPAVLRLTEALNDQHEMRARFEAIRDVGQRNLVSFEDFGDVEIDGIPLIYLVMEATEENLADIIRERRLSIEETAEVGLSLASALEALHAHGLVHGKVEPASVFAVGQVIKLRSDCIRMAPAGAEGDQARAEDVFGLTDVLNRSLTQQPLLDASDALALPEPYAAIVRNVVRGSWGMERVASELRRVVRPSAPPAPAQAVAAEPAAIAAPVATAMQPPAVRVSSSAPGLRTSQEPSADDSQLTLVYPEVVPPSGLDQQASAPGAAERWTKPHVPARAAGPAVWLAGAVGVLLLLFMAWHMTAGGNKAPAAASVRSAVRTAPAASPASPVIPLAAAALPASASPHADAAPVQGEVWRVVAYTYNVEAQAQAKAKLLTAQHADLAPQVYSRTGRAPFLVTLGGPLTRPQAATMLKHAHSVGIARDVYMQNYSH